MSNDITRIERRINDISNRSPRPHEEVETKLDEKVNRLIDEKINEKLRKIRTFLSIGLLAIFLIFVSTLLVSVGRELANRLGLIKFGSIASIVGIYIGIASLVLAVVSVVLSIVTFRKQRAKPNDNHKD